MVLFFSKFSPQVGNIVLVVTDNAVNILLVRACLRNSAITETSRNLSRAGPSNASRAVPSSNSGSGGDGVGVGQTKFDKRQLLRHRLTTLCCMVLLSDLLAILMFFGQSVFLGSNASPLDSFSFQIIPIGLANMHVLFCLAILKHLVGQKARPRVVQKKPPIFRAAMMFSKNREKTGENNFPEYTELSSVKPLSADRQNVNALEAIGEDSSGFIAAQ